MKVLSFLLMLNFSLTYAQVETSNEQEITRNQIETELDDMADNANSEDEKKFLAKFKSWTKGVSEKEFVKKTGRGLGKASSIVTTETLRPFVATGSFFRGLFGKENESSRVRALAYTFYLENEESLNDLYKDPSHLNEYLKENPQSNIMQAYKDLVTLKFKNNVLNTLKGILEDINFNPELEFDGKTIRLTDATSLEEIAEYIQLLKVEENPMLLLDINADNLNQETLEKNLACNNLKTLAPHIQITPLINVLTKVALSGEELDTEDFKSGISKDLLDDLDAFIAQFINMENGIWKNQEIMSEVGEITGALVAKFAVPSIVLGSVVSGAGAIYLGATALSAVGTGLAIKTCTKNSNQEKLLEDPDYRNFCSYVLMRNSQKLLKSKAKGFLAGQNLKDSIKMIKYRKNYIKECKIAGNSKKKCRQQYIDEKYEEIFNCMDLGYSKKECKRIRRRNLLASK